MAANPDKQTTNTISTISILKILAILLGLFFLYTVRDVLIIILIALILTAALDPMVDWLQKRKIPRPLGLLILYVGLVGGFFLVVGLIIPPLIEQFQQLAETLPGQFERFLTATGLGQWVQTQGTGEVEKLLTSFFTQLDQPVSRVFSTITDVFSGLLTAVLVLVITFYLTVQEQGIKKFVRSIVPVRHQPYVTSLVNRIQGKIGGWFRGQLILMGFVGALVYVGLLLLGVKFALLLALLAMLLELIPFLGPILAAIPAVILAFGHSPLTAVLVIGLFIVVNLIENHLLVPKTMQKAVGLNPVVIIAAMLIGAKLAGILGVILAVPVTTAIAEFLSDFFEDRRSPENPEPFEELPNATPPPIQPRRPTAMK